MTERTRQRATDVVLRLSGEGLAADGNELVADVMSAALLEQVLDISWRHQFDEDRAAPRREIKAAVADAVESRLLKGEEE
jgi:hypothetical protein